VACGQGGRILGIVKPEAQMEGVGRSQAHVGVKPEDVIQENRLDLDTAVISCFADLYIGLIPGQTKASREIRGFRAVGLKEAVLQGEPVKRETRLDPVQIQNQGVVLLATDNGGASARLLVGIGSKTVHDRWVGQQIETDLVSLFLLVMLVL
jgi:hypothetical protein